MAAIAAAPAWDTILFNNSTAREKASRVVTKWRQTRSTHVDLLVGNYLSHYFAVLADAIRSGAAKFKRPRRSDGLRFYESCLPAGMRLSPWPPTIPRVAPAGKWDWFVFHNSTSVFWDSMRPLVTHTLDHAFAKCGIAATVRAPVLHFRCASAPLNRHSQYHFQVRCPKPARALPVARLGRRASDDIFAARAPFWAAPMFVSTTT